MDLAGIDQRLTDRQSMRCRQTEEALPVRTTDIEGVLPVRTNHIGGALSVLTAGMEGALLVITAECAACDEKHGSSSPVTLDPYRSASPPSHGGGAAPHHGGLTMAPAHATYAITGATGRLGGRIARRLADAGIEQTLLARTPARAPRLAGATPAPGAYDDHEALVRALRETDRVLMVSAAESPDRLHAHRTFVDAAAEAGVAHLVYISFYAAAPEATFTLARDHWHTEQHIRASGIPFTFLRDNLYADFMPALVGADGAIRGPAGDGRAAVVAQDDIADAAVAVLRGPHPHAGRTYELTGPEALTLTDVARILTAVGGRPVSYVPETIEEAYASRAAFGAADWQLDAWVSTYTAIADGSLATVTTAIPDLTGHPAAPLEQVLRTASGPPAG
jgi:uncharacterized protein YbjT (DUF2867 family)